MALVIDGYNLLHVSDIFAEAGPGSDLHRARLALLEFLAVSIEERQRSQTTIVFDAAGAPPGLPRSLTHDGMTVHFARRYSDADEMIEEILEQHAAPRTLLVVSSDHRVQRAARRCGASFVDSEHWYAELRAARHEPSTSGDQPAKPTGEITPEETAYWLREFKNAPADVDHPINPFPPGYAEDMDDED